VACKGWRGKAFLRQLITKIMLGIPYLADTMITIAIITSMSSGTKDKATKLFRIDQPYINPSTDHS
jgi:hypothetical protein